MVRIFYILLLVLIIQSCKKSLFDDKNNGPEYIFDSYWKEIDRNYSFFPYSGLNWDSVYLVYKPLINDSTSSDSLFKLLAKTTDLLQDAHTNIYTQLGIAGNIYYFDKYPLNQIDLNESYFEFYYTGRIFEYGNLKKANIGYIKIRTFEGENKSFEEIDSVLQALNSTNGLIIDVRSNFGGEISNSKIIAGRLADTTRYACKYRVRNGTKHDDFSEWINVSISPASNGFHYNKPVAVLTNRSSYSATEWFVLFARVIPSVTIVGDTTGGGSAMPLIRELSNGWLLRVSNTQTMLPSGYDFQNVGLYPDVPVWITSQDSESGIDTILKKAISILTGL
jgi:hypothetical protein